MTTITIQVPSKAKQKLSEVVKELGGEIIAMCTDKHSAKKAKLLNEIRQGLKEVKDIEEGKAKFYSMSDLFDAKYHKAYLVKQPPGSTNIYLITIFDKSEEASISKI